MTRRSPEEIARLSSDAMLADDKAVALNGIEIVEAGLGSAVAAMIVQERMANGHGICHGGFIFLLADTAFAYACNSHGKRAVAQHACVTFLAPGKLGERLTATAVEHHRGERSGLTDVTVRNSEGEIIAEFRGHSRMIGGTPWVTP